MPILTPDGYQRVALFNTETGEVIDMSGRVILSTSTPNTRVGLFKAADGTAHEQSRETQVEFRVVDGELTDAIEAARRRGSKAWQLVAIGKASHLQLYEPGPIHLVTQGDGPGGFVSGTFGLSTAKFDQAVSRSHNLLQMLGWSDTVVVAVDDEEDTYELVRKNVLGGLSRVPIRWIIESEVEPTVLSDGRVQMHDAFEMRARLPMPFGRLIVRMALATPNITIDLATKNFADADQDSGVPVDGLTGLVATDLTTTEGAYWLDVTISYTEGTILEQPRMIVYRAGVATPSYSFPDLGPVIPPPPPWVPADQYHYYFDAVEDILHDNMDSASSIPNQRQWQSLNGVFQPRDGVFRRGAGAAGYLKGQPHVRAEEFSIGSSIQNLFNNISNRSLLFTNGVFAELRIVYQRETPGGFLYTEGPSGTNYQSITLGANGIVTSTAGNVTQHQEISINNTNVHYIEIIRTNDTVPRHLEIWINGVLVAEIDGWFVSGTNGTPRFRNNSVIRYAYVMCTIGESYSLTEDERRSLFWYLRQTYGAGQ